MVTLYIINVLAFKGLKQFFMTSFNLNRLGSLARAMKKSEDLHDVI
jgi:hypothetical protein